MLTEWALLGMGIALKPVFEVAEHLKMGALVRVLPDCPVPPVTLGLLHPYPRAMPTKVRAFAELLIPDVRAWLDQTNGKSLKSGAR